ncbi:MAG: thioredoxin family protein [Saprospiraceae bacterium]|nr:thioredoxin family protein [Saprospiraceae bacterium]
MWNLNPSLILGLCWLLLSCNATRFPKKATDDTPTLRGFTFSQVDSLQTTEARPLAVFLHTSWCQFCQNMRLTTLKNKEVVEMLNNDFYYISFDGESTENVDFRGRLYRYKPSGRDSGIHELALALGSVEGAISYPTFVIIGERNEIIFQHNAFLSGEQLATVLRQARPTRTSN